ncbi:deubiquitinase MYSM1 [Bombina bombina]|uniref:deubiquitinase MYSM1 n=1 Tax=Bombina bombina TaxID=8345 RepID=UPI00235A5390|nr:deubiquitinase MYSM1 [Bombina bombina]
MAEEADVDIEGDVNEPNKGDYEKTSSAFVPDHYLNSVWKSDDELTPWTLDNSISEENRAVIEKMLLEEEYYLSNKSLPATFLSDTKDGETSYIKRSPQKKIARVPIRSPTKPGSSPAKWTEEEKALFDQGLAEFGRRWTKIAKFIGSRTILQVKNYARQYFKNKCKVGDTEKEESKNNTDSFHAFSLEDNSEEATLADEFTTLRGRSDPNLNAVKIEKLSDDEEIDITDEGDEAHISNPHLSADKANPHLERVGSNKAINPMLHKSPFRTELSENVSSSPVLNDKQTDIEDRETFQTLTYNAKNTLNNEQCKQEGDDGPPCLEQDTKDICSGHHSSSPSMYENGNESQDEGDELKPPDQEAEIDRDFILEEEKQAIPEFFEGRPAKTPERYLKIRNYILDQWDCCKPKYLNKTSVRPGLKNCGDVNCIGRIHTFLELIGAINFGCEQAIYNRPQPVEKTKTKEGKDALEAYELAHRLQSMRTRRRRVRDRWGNWCDAKDLEGQTFEHLSAEELAKRREEKTKPSKCFKGSRQVKSLFDPFQLIPCASFNNEKKEPFQVKISAEAMLILNLHSHVSMAEVIGLLGGRYLESESVVEICTAEPCNSLSTGLQCEMDPVSQTQASEALAGQGYNVIGWYHSHPAFDPSPSIRDIDTQAKYQSYFSRGGAKFLGIIISPYNRSNLLPHSQMSCLIISDDLSEDGSYRIPYQFEVEDMLGEPRWEFVFEKTRWIIDKYQLLPSSVPMNKRFRQDSDLTCLQKLLTCLEKTLLRAACPIVAEEFLSQIEHLFHSTFKCAKDTEVEQEEQKMTFDRASISPVPENIDQQKN